MHFWIDKRSQCAYTGRHRVPSSLSSGIGGGRARGRGAYGAGVGLGGRKGMAAPVHRFAALDCPPRRPRSHSNHARQNGHPPAAAVHTRRQNDDSSLYVEIPPEPQPTIAHIAAARSVTPDTLLRTAALGLHHGSPMMAPHLKFGMLVSFALATLFLAGAKFYFDKQVHRDTSSSGGEATVVCAAVACVCGVGCALTWCRPRPAPLHTPDRVSSTAARDRPPPTLTQPEPSLPPIAAPLPPAPPSRPGSEAPPPYHIAVLLPGREPRDASPPAYSALS